jgi:hypothetical protein
LPPEFFVLVNVKWGNQEMCIEACVGLHILLLIGNPLNDSQDASCASGRADGWNDVPKNIPKKLLMLMKSIILCFVYYSI